MSPTDHPVVRNLASRLPLTFRSCLVARLRLSRLLPAVLDQLGGARGGRRAGDVQFERRRGRQFPELWFPSPHRHQRRRRRR